MECFKILGINPTKDVKEIKRAYAKLLPKFSPETDLEGFQNLRTAYEEALVEAGKEEEEKEPLSPTDEFMTEFEQHYRDFEKRMSVAAWTHLLDRDICYNLNTSEEISNKILTFIMDNYHFPHEVWKLFDDYFFWKVKRDKLCHTFPENFIDFVIYKINERSPLRYEPLLECKNEREDEFITEYEKGYRALDNTDLYTTKKSIDIAKSICPNHPDILILEARYLMNNGKIAQGLSLLNDVLEKNCNDSGALFYRGELLFGCGKLEEACEDQKRANEVKPHSAGILYSLGKSYLSLEKFDEAISCFKEVSSILTYNQEVQKLLLSSYNFQIDTVTATLESTPDDVNLKYKLAEAFYETGNIEKSYEFLCEIKQQSGLTQNMYTLMTQALLSLKKEELAYSTICEAIEKYPDDSNLITYKASILDDMGSFEQSLELYEKAIELSRDNAVIYNNKGYVLNKLGRYNEALESSNKSLNLDPNSAHAYKNKADALLNLSLYEDCLEACEESINIYPYLSEAYIIKIKALTEIGQYNDALNTCDKAIDSGLQSNELLYQKAYILYLSDRPKESISYCNSALEADENNGRLYECKGLCLYDLQEYEEALKSLDKAVELDPTLERSHYYKITSLINTSQEELAMEILDDILKMPLERADKFHDLKGDLLERAEKYEEAYREYKKAIESNPDSPYYYYSAGSVLTDLSRYQDSLAYLDKAIELDSSMVKAYITKSYALYNLGYYEKCITECNKAIEYDPEYPIAYQNKAWALYKLEKLSQAEESCNKGLKLDGDNLNLLNLKLYLLRRKELFEDALIVSDRILDLNPEDEEVINIRKELMNRLTSSAKNSNPGRKISDILFGRGKNKN